MEDNDVTFSNLRNDGSTEHQEGKNEYFQYDSESLKENENLAKENDLLPAVNEQIQQNQQVELSSESHEQHIDERDIETLKLAIDDDVSDENPSYREEKAEEINDSEKQDLKSDLENTDANIDQDENVEVMSPQEKFENQDKLFEGQDVSISQDPAPNVRIDQTSNITESFLSSDEDFDNSKQQLKEMNDHGDRNDLNSSFSSSSSSDEEDKKNQDEQKLSENQTEISQLPSGETNQLHGFNENLLSDEEETFPQSFAYKPDSTESVVHENSLAESLKQALKERDNLPQDSPNNKFLRARSANDFNNFEVPPELPPKASIPPQLPPKTKNLPTTSSDIPVFYVRDKNASLGRGRWSDDDGVAPPEAHRKKPLHPLPDRVIDFGNATTRESKKSTRRDNKSDRRLRDRTNRVIDIPRHPAEDINDVFKRQAMVSLHSSASFNRHNGRDPYDTVHDDDDEDLSRLILEANNLQDIHPQPEKNVADILLPSFRRNNPPPQTDSLTPSYPDAFAKISPASKTLETKSRRNNTEEFNFYSTNSFNNHSKSLPRKYKSAKSTSFHGFRDPQDGDDEISLGDSDVQFSKPLEQQPKSLIDHQSYLCEVFPTDYTEFDSDTETENDLVKFQDHHDVGSYDTVLETDIENPEKENQLNPIVNEDYQICTSLKPNHNTFPRRFHLEKPRPKERSSMNVMAVALTDPLTNAVQPSSFNANVSQLRRNKSIPVMKADSASLFGQTPQIVVTRGRSRSSGGPLSAINGPQSLPVRVKSKHKREDAGTKKVYISNSTQSGNDIKLPSNTGSLKINLLPSDDPNVINLNISTTASKQKVVSDQQLGSEILTNSALDQSPLSLQPLQSITAISHRPSPSDPTPLEETKDQELQHRVVEIAPVVIQSAPLIPEPMPVNLAYDHTALKEVWMPPVETVPSALLATEVVQQPIPAQRQVVPVEVYPISNPQSISPITPSAPEIEVIQRTISTHQTQSFNQTTNNKSQEPQNAIIEIKHPSWEDKYRSLPSEPPSNGSGIKNYGDSGIDVTNYRKTRRRRHSSSDDSSFDPKRSTSKRKLKDFADPTNDPNLSDEYMAWYKRTYLKPRCCYLCLKHFIFALNVLFGVIGLGLIGLGIWGFADMYYYGLNSATQLLRDPVFPIFVVGVILTLICFEGAIGFFRDNICMIKFFGWCLVLLCISFIGGAAAFWILRTSQVTPFVMNNFVSMIKSYNTTTRKVAAFTLDQMQTNLDCCGINNYSDWETLKEFPCYDSVCIVPSSCCSLGHMKIDFQQQHSKLSHEFNKTCSRNKEDGLLPLDACKNAMTLWLKNNTAIIVGCWLLVVCLFVFNFISIHFMIREILYLQAIEDKIYSVNNPNFYRSDLSSSDDITSSETDSEEEKRRRRRRRRRRKKRRERRERENYYTNKAYR